MEQRKDIRETITHIALGIFALLVALIVYTFFAPLPSQTDAANQTSKPNTPKAPVNKQATPENPVKLVHTSAKIESKPETKTAVLPKTTEPNNVKTSIQNTQVTKAEMKADDYKIPSKKPKLTDYLPEDLKKEIQATLLSKDELAKLSSEERANYRKTQKELADILRQISTTTAENQKLEKDLKQAEKSKVQLDSQFDSLRGIAR